MSFRKKTAHRSGLVAAAVLAAMLLAAGCAGTAVNSNSNSGSGSSAAGGGDSASGALPAAAPGWNPSTKTITVTSLYPESGPVAGGALFRTPQGATLWEDRARANLTDELAALA